MPLLHSTSTASERLAELQKKSLDLAAEQTADWMNAWKKTFSFFPGNPAGAVFEIAEQAIATCVTTQKKAIDIAVEQSHSVVDAAKARKVAYTESAGKAKEMFQHTLAQSGRSPEENDRLRGRANQDSFRSHKEATRTCRRSRRSRNGFHPKGRGCSSSRPRRRRWIWLPSHLKRRPQRPSRS